MFSWFRPAPPVSVEEKAWVEMRTHWLATHCGVDPLLRSPLHTPESLRLDEEAQGSEDDGPRICRRLARILDAPDDWRLAYDDEDSLDYDESNAPLIRVPLWMLDNPIALVASLARQLCQLRMHRDKWLALDDPEAAQTGELAAALLGFGAFNANAALEERTANSQALTHWWQMRRGGNLPARVIGYALALQTWLRDEEPADLRRQLRRDAADSFSQGVNYLRKTQDASIDARSIRTNWEATPNVERLIVELRSDSPSRQVQALWQLPNARPDARSASEEVVRLFDSKRREIRPHATIALAYLQEAALDCYPRLLQVLWDQDRLLRRAAAWTIGQLQLEPEASVSELALLAIDSRDDVGVQAAWSLAAYGAEAQPALPKIMTGLRESLIDCDGRADAFITLLRAIADEPELIIRRTLASDEDLLAQAITLLQTPNS